MRPSDLTGSDKFFIVFGGENPPSDLKNDQKWPKIEYFGGIFTPKTIKNLCDPVKSEGRIYWKMFLKVNSLK